MKMQPVEKPSGEPRSGTETTLHVFAPILARSYDALVPLLHIGSAILL